ncbi:MAG: hypothetical protein ACM3PY_21445, partial [Omnitrophica WOR_2 bacterium]
MHLLFFLSTLQDTTPDTSGYMIAGYSVIFVVLALYLASLAIRQRNYKRDVDMLEELEDREQS